MPPVHDPLHLVKVALRADRLVTFARSRGLPVREVDEGYLAHMVLRELWQDGAPVPFVLRGRGRVLDAWGYSRLDSSRLRSHAALRDPSLLATLDSLEAIASKPMPSFAKGRQLGFVLRACPVVRLAGPRSGHRAGAEVDAFLARCFAAGSQTAVSRDEVYRDWLMRTMSRPTVTGVSVLRVGLAAISRARFIRRTHGGGRETHRLERPEVHFEGDMVVEDGETLLGYLAHGVGRHRGFGFGALMLTPPGTAASFARTQC